MLPAGLMWSVVTESPSFASTRAPVMLGDRGGLDRHAVEVRGLAHVGRLGVPLEDRAGRGRQRTPALVAVEDARVLVVNMSVSIDESIVDCTSAASGQMSVRKTSLPSVSVPSASFSKSKFIDPARA